LEFRPDRILLLCEHEERSPAEADAMVLMSVLRLQHSLSGSTWSPNIIAELRDPRDYDLAAIARVDDIFVTDHLACLIMSQLAESPDLTNVFEEMFSEDGPLIEVVSAANFGDLTKMVTHDDLVRAGLERNQLVLGYRELRPISSASDFLIVPKKSMPIQVDTRDLVVVMHIRPDLLEPDVGSVEIDLASDEYLLRESSMAMNATADSAGGEFTGATLEVSE